MVVRFPGRYALNFFGLVDLRRHPHEHLLGRGDAHYGGLRRHLPPSPVGPRRRHARHGPRLRHHCRPHRHRHRRVDPLWPRQPDRTLPGLRAGRARWGCAVLQTLWRANIGWIQKSSRWYLSRDGYFKGGTLLPSTSILPWHMTQTSSVVAHKNTPNNQQPTS